MYNYRLDMVYDGSKYSGWQRLKDNDKTIQGKIEQVLSRFYSQAVEIVGSGRTDAGVHARGQVANFWTGQETDPKVLLAYLNHYLPEDIVIQKIQLVDERFHARFQAKEKNYNYYIRRGIIGNPFQRKYEYQIEAPLNIQAMEQAASYLIGKHDFTSFTTAKSKKKSMERTIHSIVFKESEDLLAICFKGDGFLYNMIRIIVGTLIEVGLGNLEPEAILGILESKTRANAGPLAPAQGLFLEYVAY